MKPQPLRFTLANRFVESARDMGDEMIIAAAIRVWNAVNFPRTKPCSDADKALFLEWQNQ
jgi:hypothetical protein